MSDPVSDGAWCACDKLGGQVHPYRTDTPVHEGRPCPPTRVAPSLAADGSPDPRSGMVAALAEHHWTLSRWAGGGWAWGCSCGVHAWGTGKENPSRYVRHETRDDAERSAAAHVAAALVPTVERLVAEGRAEALEAGWYEGYTQAVRDHKMRTNDDAKCDWPTSPNPHSVIREGDDR